MNIVDVSHIAPSDPSAGYDASTDVICECENCGEELTAKTPGYVDEEGNAFCSSKCCLEYYGFKAMDDDDIARFSGSRS